MLETCLRWQKCGPYSIMLFIRTQRPSSQGRPSRMLGMLKLSRKFHRVSHQAWSIPQQAAVSIRVVHISCQVYVTCNFLRTLSLNLVILLPVGYTSQNDSHSSLGTDRDWFFSLVDGGDLAFSDGPSRPAINFLSEFFLLCGFD